MAIPRFYCPIPLHPGRIAILPETVSRHALSALRLRAGDNVVLFNGDGDEYPGILEATGRDAKVMVHSRHSVRRESPLRVVLAQGVSSGERMDFTLQKAVELGVDAIQPLMMRRTVVRLEEEKRRRRRLHWQGVVMSACEQCGRAVLPEVEEICAFGDWLNGLAAPATTFLLDPLGALRLRDLPAPRGPITLLAGPEGGLDPAEREAALAAGCLALRLGPRILRTETAALAALAAMQSVWGDA